MMPKKGAPRYRDTMPAPTVSFVASSTTMNAPVARTCSYGSGTSGEPSRSRTRPISLRASSSAGSLPSVVTSSRSSIASSRAGTERVVCLIR